MNLWLALLIIIHGSTTKETKTCPKNKNSHILSMEVQRNEDTKQKTFEARKLLKGM